jgi:hypothetical protein
MVPMLSVIEPVAMVSFRVESEQDPTREFVRVVNTIQLEGPVSVTEPIQYL